MRSYTHCACMYVCEKGRRRNEYGVRGDPYPGNEKVFYKLRKKEETKKNHVY